MRGLIESKNNLEGKVVKGFPSKAMIVFTGLLDIERYIGKNRMTKFQPEALFMRRYDGP